MTLTARGETLVAQLKRDHKKLARALFAPMSRCEFDRDAILLTPPSARTLLQDGGFEMVRTDFRFIFPKALRAFRKIEDFVYKLPLGTQYMILARKNR